MIKIGSEIEHILLPHRPPPIMKPPGSTPARRLFIITV
jgi:hypothetical protein